MDVPGYPTRDWTRRDTYKARWTSRATIAAQMIGDSTAVCDLGCGPDQYVRSVLPTSVRYLPADIVAWTDETEVCDLHADIFPDRSLGAADCILLLGVIEHLPRPERIFSNLGTRCKRLIASYHPVEVSRDRGRWLNSFSESQFQSMISDHGWKFGRREAVSPIEFLYCFMR